MKKLLLPVLVLALSGSVVSAQSKDKGVEEAITGFFNGLSLVNADTIRHYTTAGFELLEDGEAWNMDTLLNRISKRVAGSFRRENEFRFISTEANDDIAWVSYFNTAHITVGDKTRTIRWLESAVLLKDGGRWKIQLLHSTVIRH